MPPVHPAPTADAAPLLPVADVHVVMNALNRLAARAMAQGQEEDPLLFALADYLSATLPSATLMRQGLAQEADALASLLALEQEASGARITWVPSPVGRQATVPRGLLLALGGALLRARQPKSGGAWVLRLECSADDTGCAATLRLEGAGDARCDVGVAQAQARAMLSGLGPDGVLELSGGQDGPARAWLRAVVLTRPSSLART